MTEVGATGVSAAALALPFARVSVLVLALPVAAVSEPEFAIEVAAVVAVPGLDAPPQAASRPVVNNKRPMCLARCSFLNAGLIKSIFPPKDDKKIELLRGKSMG